jgi:hypothetical protein
MLSVCGINEFGYAQHIGLRLVQYKGIIYHFNYFIGLGNTEPAYKLAVKGTVGSSKIKVEELQTGLISSLNIATSFTHHSKWCNSSKQIASPRDTYLK